MECLLLLHGQVRRTFEPQVFPSRPHLIPTLAEFFVLLSPHLIAPISQMLGDMEPVKTDLLVGMGKADLGRMNLRRPPIHLRIPCNWAGDHCGSQPIRVLFSRPSPTYSTVSALDTTVRYLWYATSSTQRLATSSSFLRAFPRTPLDPGNALPADPQLAGNRQKTCLLGPSDHILLKVMGIAGTCVGPGNPCNQERLIGTRILGGAIIAPYADHKRDTPCHTSDRSTKTDRYRSTLPSFVGLDHRRCLLKSPRAPGDLGFSQRRRCFACDSLNSGEP